MALLFGLGYVWWLIRMAVALLLTAGSLCLAARTWRRISLGPRWRCLVAVGALAAWAPLMWACVRPPDFGPDLRRAPLHPGGNLANWYLAKVSLRGRKLS